MTSHHAAILLLGIFGSATPKDSVGTVTDLGYLRHHVTDGPLASQFDWLDGQTLLDALTALIDRADEVTQLVFDVMRCDRDWNDEQIELLKTHTQSGSGLIDFYIEIGTSSAEIFVTWGPTELLHVVYMVDVDRFMAGEYNARMNTDRKVTTRFSRRTIVALSKTLAGN